LLLLAAVPGARAQQPATGTGAPALEPLHSDGSYLKSFLVTPKPEIPCPPNIAPLYRADVIVTGTDLRQRPWGFAQTLRQVLVKSSGDPRLKDNPAVARLAEHAGDFVVCFDYVDMMADIPIHDEQGTYDRPHRLTVTFDPAKIDAFLAQFGDKPWRGERPVIVPLLLVNAAKPPAYLLSAEDKRGADQRGSFAAWAGEFDMKSRFPSEAELAGWGVTAERFPSALPSSPAGEVQQEVPTEVPTEVVVLGTLDWNPALPGWIGKWRCRWRGVDYAWGIGGVNFDAAFRDLIGGVMLLASGNGSPE
jgi:hypothetical protein